MPGPMISSRLTSPNRKCACVYLGAAIPAPKAPSSRRCGLRIGMALNLDAGSTDRRGEEGMQWGLGLRQPIRMGSG
jgi:hypothetical protein